MTGIFYELLRGGNTGVERIPKSESAQKVDPGEENSPAAPAGIRTLDLFNHESGALTTELSPLRQAHRVTLERDR